MKKTIVLSCASVLFLGLQSPAWADSFIYGSPDECDSQMSVYANSAQNFASNNFFQTVMQQSSSKVKQCSGQTCTDTISAGCALAGSSNAGLNAVWLNLMVPLLTAQVACLSSVSGCGNTPSALSLSCTYPQGSSDDYSACTLNQK